MIHCSGIVVSKLEEGGAVGLKVDGVGCGDVVAVVGVDEVAVFR